MGYWRNTKIDWMDLDMQEWDTFETVVSLAEMQTTINNCLAPWDLIPATLPPVIATGIYYYCYGKLCNLRDTVRWKNNFFGAITLYMIQEGRYLQLDVTDFVSDTAEDIAHDQVDDHTWTKDTDSVLDRTWQRDLDWKLENEHQDQDNSGKVAQDGHLGASTSETNAVSGTSAEHVDRQLGDTLTVLNNQSTSTAYLASSTEEAYSRGGETHDASTTQGKNLGNNMEISGDNHAEMAEVVNQGSYTNTHDEVENYVGKDTFHQTEDYVGKDVKDSDVDRDVLTTTKNTEEFDFKEWFSPLRLLLDDHFLVGGVEYA